MLCEEVFLSVVMYILSTRMALALVLHGNITCRKSHVGAIRLTDGPLESAIGERISVVVSTPPHDIRIIYCSVQVIATLMP